MEVESNTNEVPGDCDMETEKINPKKCHKRYQSRAENSLRTEHCARLTCLLDTFIRQHNWKEASGVLSVLLKGTAREEFPKENRHKYLAAMELLKKMAGDHIKPTSIRNVYEIWYRKNGRMKKWSAKDRFSSEMESVLFSLTHGNIDDVNQARISLAAEIQPGCDPVLDMLLGLTYYELWYSCIPDEMKLKSSDMLHRSMVSEFSGLGSYNPVESFCCNSVDDQDIKSPALGDSETSIAVNKEQHTKSFGDVKIEPQILQPRGFYVEDSSVDREASHCANLDDTVFKCRGMDASLLPLRLPDLDENFGNTIYMYIRTLNDHYSKAVKHLRDALNSTPPVLESLLPLIQLLLLGDQVEEARKELENICLISKAVLPLRIRAILLECFDSKNSVTVSTCYEDVIKNDPTCSLSLTRLIRMHRNGDYDILKLIEMIALHLDATYPSASVWGELASSFLKFFDYGEDQLSVCRSTNESADERCPTYMDTVPMRFLHGHARNSWKRRCRWWSRRHFSTKSQISEMDAGEWELLTNKAACASHLYGPDFWYVVTVYTFLEKNQKTDQVLSLMLHRKNSVNVSEQLKYEEIIPDEHSCVSNSPITGSRADNLYVNISNSSSW